MKPQGCSSTHCSCRIKLHMAQQCVQSAEMLLFVQCFLCLHACALDRKRVYFKSFSVLVLSMFGFSDLNKLINFGTPSFPALIMLKNAQIMQLIKEKNIYIFL